MKTRTSLISPSESLQQKTVRFSDITIREYPMILGDNPSVSCGPPVTIDWQHSSEAHLPLDKYMHSLPFFPRERCQMVMPAFLREDIVSNSGYQYSDIINTMYEIDLIKTQRFIALKSGVRVKIMNMIGRKIKRVFLHRRKILGMKKS